jgi:hypothetical protein
MKDEWAGHVEIVRRKKNVYKILAGKSEGKKTLDSSRRRWEHTVKMDLTNMPSRPACVWVGLKWLSKNRWDAEAEKKKKISYAIK